MLKTQNCKRGYYSCKNFLKVNDVAEFSDGDRLENIKISFNQNGMIEVYADRLIAGYFYNNILLDNPIDLSLIEDKYLKERNIGYFRKRKKKVLKPGWFYYKKREKFHLQSYSLTIIDEISDDEVISFFIK